MSKRAVLVAASLLAGAALLLAADFWDKKPYTQWSDKEINKLMTDSPWAHKTPVQVTGGDRGGRGGGRRGGGGMAFVAQEGGGGGGRGGGGRGGGLEIPAVPTVPQVVMRWQTALPIKQITARMRYKDEVETSPDAARFLDREETNYVVGLFAVPGGAASADPNELAAGAQIEIKGKEPLQAVQVSIERARGGADLYFVFPKAEGHTISLDDKEVEVVIKTKPVSAKRKFKLQDMVYNGKLEM